MNWARAFFGILIVTVGILLLLDNADVLDAADVIGMWWPVPVILGGVLSLVANPRHWIPPLILIGGGSALLLRSTGVVDDLGGVLPILLILIGVLIVFGRGFGTSSQTDVGNGISTFTMFSGSELASHSSAFEGGKIGVLFGGVEIDLRDAVPAPGAVLDVFGAFAGVEVRVPDGWRVDIGGLPLFGGFENATTKDRVGDEAPTLRIDATVLFGGLEVKH